MFQGRLITFTGTTLNGVRTAGRIMVITLIAALLIPTLGHAQPSSSRQADVGTFLRSIVGEWVGTCEQSTNGEAADNKYFRASITQIDDNSFAGRFEYYRIDKATGSPLHIGDTAVDIAIGPDGIATSEIRGKGTVLIDEKPKNQEHELSEILSYGADGSLQGQGNGNISVSGMPLGLGKNGKITESHSQWSLNGDALTISQTVKAKFRVLFFSKSFDVAANYTAKRGSDLASLMKNEKLRIAAIPADSM